MAAVLYGPEAVKATWPPSSRKSWQLQYLRRCHNFERRHLPCSSTAAPKATAPLLLLLPDKAPRTNLSNLTTRHNCCGPMLCARNQSAFKSAVDCMIASMAENGKAACNNGGHSAASLQVNQSQVSLRSIVQVNQSIHQSIAASLRLPRPRIDCAHFQTPTGLPCCSSTFDGDFLRTDVVQLVLSI